MRDESRKIVERTKEALIDACVCEHGNACDFCQTRQVIEALEAEIARLRKALAFARSTIKSGEPWTEVCVEIIDGALQGEP